METRDLAIALDQLFTGDEKLLRMLHYVPAYEGDDPLDPAKPSILNNPDIDAKWETIRTHIKNTAKTNDLVEKQIGRVLFFMGRRAGNQSNPEFDDQDVVVDLVMHEKFAVDYRLEMVYDYLLSRLNGIQVGRFDRSSDQTIGIGRLTLEGTEPIGTIADGYMGQRFVFIAKLKSKAKHYR